MHKTSYRRGLPTHEVIEIHKKFQSQKKIPQLCSDFRLGHVKMKLNTY